MRQTFPASETIVVDDGSTDGTQALLDGYPSVRRVSQHRAGGAAARNRGARGASATWIAFLDSDDWWEPDHLERLAFAIEETNGAADFYFDDTAVVMHTFHPDGNALHTGSLWELAGFAPPEPLTFLHDASDWVLLPVQPTMLQSSAIRRDRYLALGGMRSRLLLRHDTHLFLHLGLGRPACAVHGIGSHMTDDGGDGRLTRKVAPSSKPYWDETALLYEDVLRSGPASRDARRVLSERAAIAHWRRARYELSARHFRAAVRPLARSGQLRPRLVVDRILARARRKS